MRTNFILSLLALLVLGGCASPFSKYKENEFFDKKNFSYEQFGKDAVQCAEESKKLEYNNVNMPAQAGYTGVAVGGFMEGYDKANRQKQYWLDCHFKRGYVMAEMSKEEKQKRMQAIKDYKIKFDAAKEAKSK